MNILKKLILKEWFKSFLVTFFSLAILVTVANLISGFLRSSVTASEVILNYVFELPLWINRILPISCMVATLFSINNLKTKSELISIFAAGFSRRRYIITLIQCSLVIAILHFFTSSFIDPMGKRYRKVMMVDSASKFSNAESKGLKVSTLEGGQIWYKSGAYYFSFQAYDRKVQELKNVALYYFDNKYRSESIIKAKRAKFDRDNLWSFIDGKNFFSLATNSFPRFRPFEKLSIRLNEVPRDFEKIESDVFTLNIFGLASYIARIRASGISSAEYEIVLYNKFSQAFLCLIFALIPLSSLFSPNRRGSSFGKSVAFTFLFTIFYWLSHFSILELGNSGRIPTLIASFGLSIIFICYIAWTINKNRQLAN